MSVLNLSGKQFLDRCYVRYSYGKSLKVVRVPSLKNAPVSEQLVAALLREDRDAASAILQSADIESHMQNFLDFQVAGNMDVLIYEKICQLQLIEQFEPGVIASLKKSSEYAAIACARTRAIIDNCAKLLEPIAPVWIKGPALAATLYGSFSHRYFSDFDLVVRADQAERAVSILAESGYRLDLDDPGSCHQIGAGPVSSIENLLLQPSSDLEVCHNLTLKKPDGPNIELKFNPLDTGLQMIELDRFFDDAIRVGNIRIPSLVDHLLLQLVHLHKHGFSGWKWRYDIHLLAQSVGTVDGAWDLVVSRSQSEGIAESVWAGLTLVKDRLNSAVPKHVLERLTPSRSQFALSFFSFNVPPEFLWNSSSLPMLFLNAVTLGDTRRKLAALADCMRPSAEFLRAYYGNGALYLLAVLNFVVLLAPAAFVRKSFGSRLWARSPNQTF